MSQLLAMKKMITESEEEIKAALNKDNNMSPTMAFVLELNQVGTT